MQEIEQVIHSSIHSQEKTYAVIHRHWFDLLSRFLPVIFLLSITAALCIYFTLALTAAGQAELAYIVLFIASLVFLLCWLYSFFLWVDYFLDIWVVTSSRVINIEQKGLFSRDTSELEYTHIQDVTSEISGIIQTLFNYGDVYVQTAGSNSRFMFRHVSQPEKIKTLVMHLNRQAIAKQANPDVIAHELREARKLAKDNF